MIGIMRRQKNSNCYLTGVRVIILAFLFVSCSKEISLQTNAVENHPSDSPFETVFGTTDITLSENGYIHIEAEGKLYAVYFTSIDSQRNHGSIKNEYCLAIKMLTDSNPVDRSGQLSFDIDGRNASVVYGNIWGTYGVEGGIDGLPPSTASVTVVGKMTKTSEDASILNGMVFSEGKIRILIKSKNNADTLLCYSSLTMEDSYFDTLKEFFN